MLSSPQLNSENYRKGFLIDEELMAGISEDSSNPGMFIAFVLRHTTGEYLGRQQFTSLDLALRSINQIPRAWVYEATSGCGGGECGDGNCSKAEGKGCAGSACTSKICQK